MPYHVGLSIGQFTPWQPASLRAREHERENKVGATEILSPNLGSDISTYASVMYHLLEASH